MGFIQSILSRHSTILNNLNIRNFSIIPKTSFFKQTSPIEDTKSIQTTFQLTNCEIQDFFENEPERQLYSGNMGLLAHVAGPSNILIHNLKANNVVLASNIYF